MLVQDLLKKNKTYTFIEPTMLEYQRAYLSGINFKEHVRKKRSSEDAKLHQDVIDNTAAMPISRYVVDTINNTVFGQPISRELEFAYPNGLEIDNESLTEWSELVCYDADLNNRSMNQVMEQIGELTSIYGHCWVFVDMPSQSQGSSYRPYVVPVNPLQVYDWNFTYINGKPIVSYIKVLESETNEHYIFKTYHLGSKQSPSYHRTYIVPKNSNMNHDITFSEEGFYPPGMSIPGFISYTRRDPRVIDIGVSDIDSASEVQREVYKLECEAYQSIQFARTLIRADNGIKVPAGAGGIVRATQGQIETLSVDTQDVTTIISKQQDLLTNLENLLGFGGLRQNRQQAQSGVSIIEERRNLHKVASAKAREMESTEEKIWTYMARFMDMRWAGNIVYGTDYEDSDIKLKVSKLEVANQLSGTNPIIKGIIDRSVLELLVDGSDVDFYLQKMNLLDSNTVKYTDPNEETEIETNDLGSQLPDEPVKESTQTSLNTTQGQIIDTGISSYNPVADQLLKII